VCHVDAPDPEREAFYREVQQTPEERLASETLEEHCNRKAFADRPPRPSWMPAEERPRPYVGVPKSKRDWTGGRPYSAKTGHSIWLWA